MISYPALALRRSVHRRFVKGLPPGAVAVCLRTDRRRKFFWLCFGLLCHAPIGVS